MSRRNQRGNGKIQQKSRIEDKILNELERNIRGNTTRVYFYVKKKHPSRKRRPII